MRSINHARIWVFWGIGCLLQGQALVPDVQERKLPNGVRILLVERRGVGSVHARLFLQGGRADTGTLPSVAAELMANSLFGPPLEGGTKGEKDLEPLLKWEEGIFESLRLERIQHARRKSEQTSQEMADLRTIHQQALERVLQLGAEAESRDPLRELGVTRSELHAEADLISFGVDLPIKALDSYFRIIAQRLNNPLLARFPLERDRLLRDMESRPRKEERALEVVLSTAFSGHPYAQVSDLRRASVEALGWSSVRAHARWAVAPERVIMILIGDLRMQEIAPTLERSLGALRPVQGSQERKVTSPEDLPNGVGARRLQASLPEEKRLFMGWRVPPMTHPDHHALQVLVQLLGGGKASRLVRRLAEGQQQAPRLSVKLGIPGGKDANLLLIEAVPGERQGLTELEQVIQGELIRLQRGEFQEGEIRRAQRQVEVGQVMIQEDASGLAEAMGTSLCQGGDWRLAFRALQVKQNYSSQEIQTVALKYLVPDQSITALLEPDPLMLPQDHLESQTSKILTKILETKLENPGQIEAVVRGTLRQLRMLPLPQREQALRLLESQVKP